MSADAPVGEISEYCIKIEFQAHGSPHAHCLLWVKNAPLISSNGDNDETVCNFVEKYVHGHILENTKQIPDVKDLVMKLQTHAHSSYCRLQTKCKMQVQLSKTTKYKNNCFKAIESG